MFRRRKSGSHHQPLSSSSAQSAQSAASRAFLNSQPSSSNLSAAAAAAALRSLTPTPTPIENVQTKRMVQRRASVSSQSSSLATALRPSSRDGLRRARSSSSMASRTFRDQSPGGPGSSSGLSMQPPPPIPSIPRAYSPKNKLPPRRSASAGPSSGRPIPTEHRPASSGGRDRSMDFDSKPNSRPELQRAGSRNSINFSYPMNSRPNSPTWLADRRDGSTDASLAGQLASSDIPRRQSSISQTANTSARRKTKTGEQTSPGRTTIPGGTAVAAAQAAVVPRNDGTVLRSPSASPRAAGRRDRITQEAGSSPRAHSTVTKTFQSTDKKLAVGNVPKDEGTGNALPVQGGRVTPDDVKPAIIPSTPEQASEASSSSVISPPRSTRSDDLRVEAQSMPQRQPSSSPGKSTRFYTHLSMTPLAGDQLHQPPPRSVSPAKSAMKRKSSLSPEGRTAAVLHPGPPLSEISDATSGASDDGSKPATRKKPVKVSFDDEAEVVGVAASPPTSSENIPLGPSLPGKTKPRSSWFGKVKRRSSSVKVDEFDEVLKPRPALPSFGSIRGSKNGQPPEIASQEFSDNESTASLESSPVSFSNDHAIAGVLSNPPLRGIRKITPSEPDPSPAPADAAASATGGAARAQDLTTSGMIAELDSHATPTDRATTSDISWEQPPELQHNLELPGIAVQPATPELEHGRSSLDWYTVPGGFPRSSLEHDPRSSKGPGKRDSQIAALDTSATLDGGGSDDESGESIYSDAEEDFEGPSFGSINAIVGDSQAGVAKNTADDNSYIANGNHPNMPELPETCKIAEAVVPAREVAISEILESTDRALPFPASNPPPTAVRPTPRLDSMREISRSTAVPSLARRSVSVDVYDSSPTANATSRDINGSVQPDSRDGVSFFRRSGKDPAKRRSLSWGPALLKGGKSSPVDESHVTERRPSLQRQLSNGSDSGSSFKRSHRSRADSQHTMRRTLRSGPPTQAQPSKPKPMLASSNRPVSSSGPRNGSLRSTLRANEPRREKPSFFSTGKVHKARQSTAPFTSRFADSDDEGGGHHAASGWRSRYAESSDEEGHVSNTLRPVRGIPRRKDMHDGDSTELEDSSDNDDRRRRPAAAQTNSSMTKRTGNKNSAPPARDPALAAVAKSRGMTENELDDFLHQPSGGRRSGLLQRLSLRKSRSPAQRTADKTPKNQAIDEEDPGFHGNGGNFVTTTITTNNGAPASSSKLKKGAQKESGEAGNWPLNGASTATSNKNPPTEQSPPQTNGVGRNGTAAVETIPEEAESPPSPASQRLTGEGRHLSSSRTTGAMDVGFGGPRKKRFPRLRRAFGLH